MKKTRLLTLLTLSILPLTACGTENIKPEEAVEKTIPALVKNSIDTYEESGCVTAKATFTTLKAKASYGDYSLDVTLSGDVSVGLRNMYTTNVDELQIGTVFDNCTADIKIGGVTENGYDIKLENFSFGAYLANGSLYVDISNTALINTLAQTIADAFKMDIVKELISNFADKESTVYKMIVMFMDNASVTQIKNILLGDGKYKFENVLTNDKLPLYAKGGLTEEKIAKAIKDVFGYVDDADLAKIMTLAHDKNANTYDLSFKVDDPAVVNRTYDNTKAKYEVNCTAVNLDVKSSTNDKGVFTSGSLKGSSAFDVKVKEDASQIKFSFDVESSVGLDFTAYTIKNPTFSDFSSTGMLVQMIKLLVGGLAAEN